MAYKIMIVEGESIVALNFQMRLTKLGYIVTAIAGSASQALKDIALCVPDIVLMDIHIKGGLDGIDATALITDKFHIPVIYLTAFSEETLRLSRATKPHGYLLKPFVERELHAMIQVALERHELEMSIGESEQRLRFAMDAANMGDWKLTNANDGTQQFYAGRADTNFGYGAKTFTGSRKQFLQLIYSEDRALFSIAMDRCVAESSSLDVEFRSSNNLGDCHWLRLQGKVFGRDHQSTSRVIGVVQNINDQKQAGLRLQQASTIFESTQDGILILDVNGIVTSCNKAYTEISGYEMSESLNKPPYFLQNNMLTSVQQNELKTLFVEGGRWRGEISARKKDGNELPTLTTIAAVVDAKSNLSHYVLVVTDLTAVRNAQRKLSYLAHHDPLTSLPNRLLTTERLNHALLRGTRHSECVAVLFIDLDHFKWINDSLGHGVGDQLLQYVALRLKACLRGSDTVGRLGGDEFLIILDPVDAAKNAALIACKLNKAINGPMQLEGVTLDVSCSIGISMFPEDGTNVEDLIRCADTAMYVAKERGRNGYEFYTPIMQHPERGLLGANEIIPLAEDCGMIVDIGNWVLREVGNQLHFGGGTEPWRYV